MLTAALPSSSEVDAKLLGQVFDHATTAYKFLLFGSIFDAIGVEPREDAPIPLSLVEVAAGMLAWAYYPAAYFRLSLGAVDKAQQLVRSAKVPAAPRPNRDGLRTRFMPVAERERGSLLRYVLARFLRPFFALELRGLPDWRVDKETAALADSQFATRTPFYKFNDEAMYVHPRWARYMARNRRVVTDWFLWNWCQYLVSRNLSVPSVSSKLLPVEKRNLTWQREYWEDAISKSRLHCPYSGNRLSRNNFALDHFLPWKFVAHDDIWNLTPAAPEANQAKSDRLPDECYVRQVAKLQHRAMQIAKVDHPHRWKKARDQYLIGLRLESQQELDLESRFVAHLALTISPLLRLAESQGFECGWRHQGSTAG